MQIALAIPIGIVYNIRAGLGLGPAYADVAQVVAHILGKDEVTSSSLVISSTSRWTSRQSSRPNLGGIFAAPSSLLFPAKARSLRSLPPLRGPIFRAIRGTQRYDTQHMAGGKCWGVVVVMNIAASDLDLEDFRRRPEGLCRGKITRHSATDFRII